MTIQTLGGVIQVPHHSVISGDPSFTGLVIDASGEKVAVIFRVPKTGTISKVGLRTFAVTTSETLRVGLQTIDAAGDPTGTAYGGMVAGTQAAPAANTWYTVALGTGATATVDNVIAAVIEFDSAVGNLSISIFNIAGSGFPYANLFTAAWAHSANLPVLSIEYSDGTYEHIGIYPTSGEGAVAFNSGSTPDEYALRFSLPVPLRIVGVWANADIDAAAEFVLYEGTTAQRTIVLSSGVRGSTALSIFQERFSSSFTTVANTTYYISLKPTTTSNVALYRFIIPFAAPMGQFSLGANAYQASRTDAGVWSTDTSVRPWIGLLVDGLDDGAGAGGMLVHPGMTGGMRG